MVCFYKRSSESFKGTLEMESTTKKALTMFLSLPYTRQLPIKKRLCCTQSYT